jgi:hypothetical protein
MSSCHDGALKSILWVLGSILPGELDQPKGVEHVGVDDEVVSNQHWIVIGCHMYVITQSPQLVTVCSDNQHLNGIWCKGQPHLLTNMIAQSLSTNKGDTACLPLRNALQTQSEIAIGLHILQPY